MRRWFRTPLLCSLVGCWEPLDLPYIDEVPIEGPDFIPCADDLDDQPVACVIDGDTFDVTLCRSGDENRIRMLAIQAPEISGATPECFGPEATTWLEQVISSEDVTLTYDADCTGAFGRTLAYVWARGDVYDELARDGDLEDLTDYRFGEDDPALMLNEVMLRLGLARLYPEEIAGELYYQQRFDAAAAAAEANVVGLYSACQ